MDINIIANTNVYAKPSIASAVSRTFDVKHVEMKEIYVPIRKDDGDKMKAALVDGLTQAQKTWKVFDLLSKRIKPASNTLVLFVTQANNISAANQVISRAKTNESVNDIFDIICNMQDSKRIDLSTIGCGKSKNVMLTDYWNSRNMDLMLQICQRHDWDRVYIVFDEADSGQIKGLQARLDFVLKIERAVNDCPVRIVFVTATVANLCKSIVQIANSPSKVNKFKGSVVQEIILEQCVEHYYAFPRDTYIGPSWFVYNNPDMFWRLEWPKGASKEEKRTIVFEQLDKLSDAQKEFCLISTSIQQEEHRELAKQMFILGFNVTIEMNSNNNRNYSVYYRSLGGKVKKWQLPFAEIETLAEKGKLKRFADDGAVKTTGIDGKYDITLTHMLQASIFMGTNVQKRITSNVKSVDEMLRLKAINNAICATLDEDKVRPEDWPIQPRVALIAGAIAGRGNTFQNAQIDMACTAFCFAGNPNDNAKRGAMNAQRFGRACGVLGEIFVAQDRRPVLIATEFIVKDSLANELALREKAETLKDGQLVSLRDLISKADWDSAVAKSKNVLLDNQDIQDNTKGKLHRLLLSYYKLSHNGSEEFTLSQINKNQISKTINDTDHRRTHRDLVKNGFITDIDKKVFKFSIQGLHLAKTIGNS